MVLRDKFQKRQGNWYDGRRCIPKNTDKFYLVYRLLRFIQEKFKFNVGKSVIIEEIT